MKNTRTLAGSLPMYSHLDMEYFVDFRCQELRPIETPHKPIPFLFIMDETMKSELRAIRAEFWGSCFMHGLDN
jgi:hypothetical protein